MSINISVCFPEFIQGSFLFANNGTRIVKKWTRDHGHQDSRSGTTLQSIKMVLRAPLKDKSGTTGAPIKM